MQSLVRCFVAGCLPSVTVVPLSAADNELTEQEKPDGWQLLFNGQDLTGWKCNNDKIRELPAAN